MLSQDPDFHFEILRDLSAASYGAGDIAEILTAANQIIPMNFESFSSAFLNLATSVQSLATKIDPRRFPISARDTYLRASTYFRSADFYLHGNPSDPRIMTYWAKQLAAFDAAAALFPVPAERVNITADGFYIPAILYRPTGDYKRRPTVMIGGGYDGGQEELYHQVAINIVERGWNAITYEGPGQASPRRYQNLGFIFEWEKVVTPIVDYLETLDDVDTSRIASLGLSFGGLLIPRASAFEKRPAATLAVDGLYEFGPLLLQSFPAQLQKIFSSGNATAFDAAIAVAHASPTIGSQFKWFIDQGTWAWNTTSPFVWMTKLQQYTLKEDVQNIPGPIFVADSATDAFLTGQGKVLSSYLGNRSTYYEFDVQSGVGHAGVGGYRMQNQVAFDWLQGVFDNC
jgi:hypothetical protein